MRKSILCVILGCFFSILCHGQVSFGVNTSITSSTLSEKLAKSKTGIQIGVLCNYDLNEDFTLLSGLGYVVKGVNGLWSDLNYSQQLKMFDVQLSYLELPLSLGYKIPIGNNIRLIPNVGIFVTYGLHGHSEIKSINFEAEEVFRFADNSWNPFNDEKFNDWAKTTVTAFERWDYGVRSGLNIEAGNIICHGAYDLGFNKVWNGYGKMGNALKSRSLIIGIGYKF